MPSIKKLKLLLYQLLLIFLLGISITVADPAADNSDQTVAVSADAGTDQTVAPSDPPAEQLAAAPVEAAEQTVAADPAATAEQPVEVPADAPQDVAADPAASQAVGADAAGVSASEAVSGLLSGVHPFILAGVSGVLGQVIGNAAVSKTVSIFGKPSTVSLDKLASAQSLSVKFALANALMIPVGQKMLGFKNLFLTREGDTRNLTTKLTLVKPDDVSVSIGLGTDRAAELTIAELKFADLFSSIKDTPLGKVGLSDIKISVGNFLVSGTQPIAKNF